MFKIYKNKLNDNDKKLKFKKNIFDLYLYYDNERRR